MSVDRREKRLLPIAHWPSAEEASAMRWFSPLDEGRLSLKTRTWIPAMVPWRATPEGEVSDAVIEWYARFAEGRPGAIVIEATGIRDIPSGPLLRIGHDRYIPGLRRLADAVRAASGGETKLFIQLIDFLSIKRRPHRDKFILRFLKLDERIREAAPSADDAEIREWLCDQEDERLQELFPAREFESMTMGYRERVTDVDIPEIASLPESLPALFAEAAARAEAAGIDGVELHYAHAYTMASFLSRRNTRNDGYGTTREGRVRLPLEVLRAVRARVKKEYPVGLRFLGDEVIQGGSDLEDATFFALRFAEAGADFLSISKGGKFEDAKQPKVGEAAYPYTGPSGHECMPTVKIDAQGPFSRNVPLAAAIRATLRKAGKNTPIITAGGICSPWQAEEILSSGEADIVAAARQSLADPDWFQKIRDGLGSQVRRCFFTNYCEGLDQKHKAVTCQRWDRDFDREDPSILRSADGKRRLTAPHFVKN